ncbi:AMP-binding protein [Amycolatopsis sp. cg5]|uniref:AMP-binding protein n=1 Tax=Amycolatopsis sp. cg5 TaxID=3238802 RepID=UPI0035239B35
MSIVDRFRAKAAEFPDRTAVRDGESTLTYAELADRANRMAASLVREGVRRGDVIGVHMRRSADAIVALLGILQAGAAYLALDTRYPDERVKFMLSDAGVDVVITEVGKLLPGEAAVHTDGEDLAYVAYTSGSTGKPKGVMVPHRGVTRLVIEPDFVDITPDDVFLQLAPIAFDASTLEIWGALLSGAQLVIPPAGDLSLSSLTTHIRESGVTVLWLTAGLFHQVVDFGLDDLKGLRYLLAGGDVLSTPHVAKALEALPETVLVNGYGPTENTTFTCCHRITAADGPIPIGRAINGTTVTVLDEHLEPSDTGELFTSGDGLAHGYLGRPALTAEKFLPAPGGTRMYRTGDLVHNGPEIEFVGRADRQVKIRGFRIELGEIEAAVAAIPEVAQHCLLIKDTPGGKSIQAAVVLASELSLLDLRRTLGETLPSYAVPSLVTVVDALPLTVNGKVDTKALEAKIGTGRPDLMCDYREPSTPAEKTVVELWSDHLGITGIGADDDFFELGGHSLLGVRIIADLHREFGVEVSPRTFYLNPTPAGMAEAVTQEEAAA